MRFKTTQKARDYFSNRIPAVSRPTGCRILVLGGLCSAGKSARRSVALVVRPPLLESIILVICSGKPIKFCRWPFRKRCFPKTTRARTVCGKDLQVTMMMRTIVTGGAGFIGSHLVDRLLADGAEVIVVDNFDPFYARAVKEANLADALRSPRCRLVELDIRDAAGAKALMDQFRPDAIVHLAARAGVRPSIEDPALYADVNVLGTVHWLEAASRLEPLPRFVYASSSSVYGDRPDAPFRETDSVDLPISPYAATKKACELLAFTFHHLHGLPVTGLRFFTAYGPRNRPDLAIAKFTRLIDRGEPVPMFGDGTTRRDYTFVGDIVDGIIRAINRCEGHHLYNLGNSNPIVLTDLVDAIGRGPGEDADHRALARTAGGRPADLCRHQPSHGRTGLCAEDFYLRRPGELYCLVSNRRVVSVGGQKSCCRKPDGLGGAWKSKGPT